MLFPFLSPKIPKTTQYLPKKSGNPAKLREQHRRQQQQIPRPAQSGAADHKDSQLPSAGAHAQQIQRRHRHAPKQPVRRVLSPGPFPAQRPEQVIHYAQTDPHPAGHRRLHQLQGNGQLHISRTAGTRIPLRGRFPHSSNRSPAPPRSLPRNPTSAFRCAVRCPGQ